MSDASSLDRFVTAQAPVIATVLEELRAGRKRTHWMWFIFPQLRGLGISSTAQFYGLEGLGEAEDYAAHPVLGPRLLDCTRAVLDCGEPSLHAIFGSPDDMKFRSCMTLFDIVTPGGPYDAALEKFCGGERDKRTLELLR
ncbi:DUF1810 domain-containing protein [Acetobacteraceae bacterium H6797]|nr:DUF1810 domain-containing protein [Acetobacteraceae bacterium H6797]